MKVFLICSWFKIESSDRTDLPVIKTTFHNNVVLELMTWSESSFFRTDTYRCGCRCVSSYLTSDETVFRRTDKGTAACRNESINEWRESRISWRTSRTACIRIPSPRCAPPWKTNERLEFKEKFFDFEKNINFNVRVFLSYLSTWKPIICT